MDKTLLLLLMATSAMLLAAMFFLITEDSKNDGLDPHWVGCVFKILATICSIISILIFIIVLIRCAVWLVDIAVPHLADFLTWSLS